MFYKLFLHMFAAIFEALIVAGHKFYVYPPNRMRPPITEMTTDNVIE